MVDNSVHLKVHTSGQQQKEGLLQEVGELIRRTISLNTRRSVPRRSKGLGGNDESPLWKDVQCRGKPMLSENFW